MRKKKSEWWEIPFKKGLYPLESISADWRSRTAQEVSCALRLLKLKSQASLLDVGCGTGRHSIEFARSGLSVMGVDISPYYLKIAKKKARKRRLSIEFKACDMREIPFEGKFDAAVNLFSSFGYFSKASDDLKMMRGIYGALKPGGKFLIDNLNFDFLKSSFLTSSWSELSDGTLILEKREPIRKDQLLITHWRFISPKGRRSAMTSRIRGYSTRQLEQLLRRAGFRNVQSCNSLMGLKKGPTSPRSVLLAYK